MDKGASVRRKGLTLGVSFTCFCAGCGPSIHSFNAEPNVICHGSPTQLSWDATASGTLTSLPVVTGTGSVESRGSKPFVPEQTTHFHLEVSNWFGHAGGDVDVTVQAPAGDAKVIGQSMADPTAACGPTGFSVTVVAPADFWDPKLRVGRVVSQDGRVYHVVHGGRTGDVAPNTGSDAFRGTEVSGTWELTTPLSSGEACGKNGPRSLMITVSSSCSP